MASGPHVDPSELLPGFPQHVIGGLGSAVGDPGGREDNPARSGFTSAGVGELGIPIRDDEPILRTRAEPYPPPEDEDNDPWAMPHADPSERVYPERWTLGDTLLRPGARIAVGLQMQGMKRRQKLDLLWEKYHENPTWKRRLMLIGGISLQTTILAPSLYFTFRAARSGVTGAEIGSNLMDLMSGGGGLPFFQEPGSSSSNTSIHDPSSRTSSSPSAISVVKPPVAAPETKPSNSPNATPTPKSAFVPIPSKPSPEATPSAASNNSTTVDTAQKTKNILEATETLDTSKTTSTPDGITVPTELASYSNKLGDYEWDEDRKLHKGTVWYHVDSYARELGIRDQLDDKEFRAIVDQALIDNKVGGEGASYAERWDAAEKLGNKDTISLSLDLFEGKTDKPLVVAGGGELPVDRFKEDNGVHGTLTIDGKTITVQNDGDLVIDDKEIDTSVAKGSTLKDYLAHVNGQFDSSMQMSAVELQLLEAKLAATPEIATPLGLDAKSPNPKAAMTFYGNVPAANNQAMEYILQLGLDKDEDETSATASTSPSKSVSPTAASFAPLSPSASAPSALPSAEKFVSAEEKYWWVSPAGGAVLATMLAVLVGGSIKVWSGIRVNGGWRAKKVKSS